MPHRLSGLTLSCMESVPVAPTPIEVPLPTPIVPTPVPTPMPTAPIIDPQLPNQHPPVREPEMRRVPLSARYALAQARC
jgi:hypothetical protein